MAQTESRPTRTLPLNLQFATSGIRTERRAVIRGEAALAALWREHVGDSATAPPPTVDFRGVDVIAYFAGGRSSGGYSVSIAGVRRVGRIAIVSVVISNPAPGERVALSFTYPGAMRTVPKLPLVVRFEVTEKTR